MYSPAVEAHIGTANGTVDVSDDITVGWVTRITSGVSSAQLTLKNQGSKYDGLFDSMDKVVIYLRRLTKMLVFSGYLDSAPAFTVYAQSVTLKASCTLKLLQNWPWDPGSPAAVDLLNTGVEQTDTDLTRKTIAVLTKVTQWPKEKIHIGQVPTNWLQTLSPLADKLVAEADAAQMALALGDQSTLGGTTIGGSRSIKGIGPGTGTLPNLSGRATTFGGGPLTKPPSFNDPGAHGGFALTGETYPNYRDLWYCAMRWPYAIQDSTGAIRPTPGCDVGAAKAWWKNRLIMVVNPANKKACIVRAADWGPAITTGNNIDLGPAAIAYLSGESIKGPDSVSEVQISFAPAGTTRTGPVNTDPAAAGPGQALQDQADSSSGGTVKVSKNDATLGSQIVQYALTFRGVPYVWGGTTPNGFDCSGFVQYVMKHFGIQMQRVADDQAQQGENISASQAQAGDLVFFHETSPTTFQHVGLCMGGGQMIAAPHTGTDVQVQAIYQGAAGPNAYKRVVGVPGGVVSAPTGDGGAQAGQPGQSTDPSADPATALFNIWAWLAQVDPTSDVLGGIRALMNDVPVLSTINDMMNAGMRDYSSAPNGDFIAWFPDYFGHYGTAAKLIIRDIELLRDFSVAKSDASLRTHVYVTSTAAPAPVGVEPGPTDISQMVGTAGVATVEMPSLMKAIFGVDPKKDKHYSSDYILQRYGARVDWTPMQNISGNRAEFFFAVMRFALNWAQQYAAQVPLTFMPEAWPGMLLQLPQYGMQGYIKQVTHNFDLRQGGGFTTDATVIAPSSIGKNGLKGLPLGGIIDTKVKKRKKVKK